MDMHAVVRRCGRWTRSACVLAAGAASLLATTAFPGPARAAAPFAGASPPITFRASTPVTDQLIARDDDRHLLVRHMSPYGYAVVDLLTGSRTELQPPLPGCEVGGGRGGLIASCHQGEHHVLFSRPFAGGDWVPFPVAWGGTGEPEYVSVREVGTRWVALELSVGMREPLQLKQVSRSRPPAVLDQGVFGTGAVPALNRPSGGAALCRPMQRQVDLVPDYPGDDVARVRPFSYAKPWGMDTGRAYDGPIRLHRCGSRKVITVCRYLCADGQLAGHFMAWINRGRTRFVRDLRAGRTRAITLPAGVPNVHLMGEHVLVSTAVDGLRTDWGFLRLPRSAGG